MSFVKLLTSDIAPRSMGLTYSHEHVVRRPAYWMERGQEGLLLDDSAKNEEEVRLAKLTGVNIIMDATAIDYERDPEAVYQVSLHTGVQVIGATRFNKGFLWDAKMPGEERAYRRWIDKSSMEELTRLVINEVEVGMQDAGVKGGQVKSGIGYSGVSPLEIETIWTGYRAHLETGTPVCSHTETGTMALEQVKYIREGGVDLSHVSFGHVDQGPNTYYRLKIADTGAFLCFDGIVKVKYDPESVGIGYILELAKWGYQKQILVSRDTARRSYYRNYTYALGLPYIKEVWAERLVEKAEVAGFDGRTLVQGIFVNNSRRCFTFKKWGGVG